MEDGKVVLGLAIFLMISIVTFLLYAPLLVSISFDVERDPPVANENQITFRGIDEIPAILRILNKHDVRSTFFVTGRVVERYPEALARIKEDGHEIGVHGGYYHDRVFVSLTKEEQRDMISQTADYIKDSVGISPLGFRAPGHRIDSNTLSTLEELNFLYDSSVVPSAAGWYLYAHPPSSPERPYRPDAHNPFLVGSMRLTEVPLTPVFLNGNLDTLLGYQGKIITEIELLIAIFECKLEGTPLVLYLHPGLMVDLPNKPSDIKAGKYLQGEFDDILYFLDRFNVRYVRMKDLVTKQQQNS